MGTGPAAGRSAPATRSRSLLATPARQAVVVIATTGAVAMWLYLAARFRRPLVAPLTLEVLLDGIDSDTLTERWSAHVVAVLLHGHLPVLALLACWGVGLAVHSAVRSWREPLSEQVKSTVGPRVVLPPGLARVLRHEPSDRVPPLGMVWIAVLACAFTVRAATAGWMVGRAPFWDRSFGAALWVTLVWVAVAVLAGLTAVALHVRRRRYLRDPRHRPRSRGAGAVPLLTRTEEEPATVETRRADGLMVGAMVCAALALGPLGLALGVWGLRHSRLGWGAVLVVGLNALHTLVLAVALVLAVVAG
ncbi:hypothetical protein SAMN05216184_101194 [Georgenia satyanarayanai]|uniref:Uncharacterized protein n=1 Tax=Georgenia satyanarayanai TaxID=860221 RepID=A0A2Y8ZVY5_9MICO|nr:hypothetical protein [Georgenia satyanarayanai]PYG01730.1 hypothetical protein A8987_101194 [Georgenia satyanarayanai]SSA36530.1 hypothetical protein SAMN05216184_101194 [Georgenia satyanarayanai]